MTPTGQRMCGSLSAWVCLRCVAADNGNMGGSASEEFLLPCEVGEDTFVESPGGYRANVEAVTTVPPEPVEYDDAPAAAVHHTPGTDTIQTLVDAANADHPRQDRAWTAADTLKNVVVAVVTPEGERRVAVIAVPGDRDVDFKRAEATIGAKLGIDGEVSVEAASQDDMPLGTAWRKPLVRGYIGPAEFEESADGSLQQTGRNFLGASEPVDLVGTPMKSATAIPYLVDPRVVEGTSWVTGANKEHYHVFGLVAGRDFTWDDTIESVVVRDGDAAPDGSGPLTTRRGIELGHIFMLGRYFAEVLDLKVLDENGKQSTVAMGSYGFGVTRAMAALVEANHDDKGIIWPAAVAPADIHLVATGKGTEVYEAAEKLAAELEAAGLSVIYDDRPKASPGVKFGDAELLGVPTIVVVGRGLAEGNVEVKDRRSGEAENIAVDGAVAHLIERAASLV